MAEGIAPAAGVEAVDPSVLDRVERGHLLVESAAAGIRVAHEERGAEPPVACTGEHGIEKRILTTFRAIRHVHRAHDERGVASM
jgi:hypothetical protein